MRLMVIVILPLSHLIDKTPFFIFYSTRPRAITYTIHNNQETVKALGPFVFEETHQNRNNMK